MFKRKPAYTSKLDQLLQKLKTNKFTESQQYEFDKNNKIAQKRDNN